MSSQSSIEQTRRGALKCLAFGGAGTLFVLSGGVLAPVNLAFGAAQNYQAAKAGTPLFVQISDTHIGFKADANPDVAGTVGKTIDLVNAMPDKPAFIMHTGDITHLSKPEEFDLAAQLLSGLKVTELHTVPGEHDVIDGPGAEYFKRYGKPSANKGYYSFDHNGVHFVALVNVMNFKANGLGALGSDQLQWLEEDLKARTASTPIVVFAHMPLWTIYETLRFGDRAERPHPSDRAEGGREHHLPHRALHGLSATDRGRRARSRAAQGRERSPAENARRHQRQNCAHAGRAVADRYAARLISPTRISIERNISHDSECR